MFEQVVYTPPNSLYGKFRVSLGKPTGGGIYYFGTLPNITSRVKRTDHTHSAVTRYGRYDYVSFYLQRGSGVSVDVGLDYSEDTPGAPSEDAEFYFLDYNNFLSFRNGRGFHPLGESYVGRGSFFSALLENVTVYGEYYAVLGVAITGRMRVRSHAGKWLFSEWNITVKRTFLNVAHPTLVCLRAAKCLFPIQDGDTSAVVVQVHNSSDFARHGPYTLDPVTSIDVFARFKVGHRIWIFGVPTLFCVVVFVIALVKAYRKVQITALSSNANELPPVMSVCQQFAPQGPPDYGSCGGNGANGGNGGGDSSCSGVYNSNYGGNDFAASLNFPSLDAPEDCVDQPLLEKAKEFGQSLDATAKPRSGIGILARSTSSSSLHNSYSTSTSPSTSSNPTSIPLSVSRGPAMSPVTRYASFSGVSSAYHDGAMSSNPQRASLTQKNFKIKTGKNSRRTSRRKN